jgi:hypothetical protein
MENPGANEADHHRSSTVLQQGKKSLISGTKAAPDLESFETIEATPIHALNSLSR